MGGEAPELEENKKPRHHVEAFEFLNVSAFRHADSCVRKYRFPPRSLAAAFIKKT